MAHFCGEIEGDRTTAAFPCGLPAKEQVTASNGLKVYLCPGHLKDWTTGNKNTKGRVSQSLLDDVHKVMGG
jgi:hypothetical protein